MSRIKYLNDWKRQNNKNYYFSFSQEYDADVIEILDRQDNKTKFVRDLIRERIAK